MAIHIPSAADLTGWHKSSHSHGQDSCVEIGTTANWHKSSYSHGQDTCVEVDTSTSWVGVRDTKLGADSPVLTLPAAQWQAFLTNLR